MKKKRINTQDYTPLHCTFVLSFFPIPLLYKDFWWTLIKLSMALCMCVCYDLLAGVSLFSLLLLTVLFHPFFSTVHFDTPLLDFQRLCIVYILKERRGNFKRIQKILSWKCCLKSFNNQTYNQIKRWMIQSESVRLWSI